MLTIADLVAAPDPDQDPFRTLVHVEYQLRVLGLLCAAADSRPAKFSTPGSLEKWADYSRLQSEKLGCIECRENALAVAAGINTLVVAKPEMSIKQVRNQVCHGGPVPQDVDLAALHQVVSQNAEWIVQIHEHGHVGELAPLFRVVDGSLAALHSFSGTAATYWPRRGDAVDVTDHDTVAALNKLELQRGDRLLNGFAQDIERDLKGFAERDSVCTLVTPPEPIVVRWDRRSSDGPVPRVDRFEITADHARVWLSESGPKPYKAFLADACNWPLLKRRLLEELEEQLATEKQVSQDLFPNLQQHIPHVQTLVEINDAYQGTRTGLTITQACAEVTGDVNAYRGSTNLITLTGEAGSGKTHSLLQFARESLTKRGDLEPVAIYISSSKSSATSLKQLINDRVAGTRILDRESVLALCRAGLAILVIDGFDEMLGFRTYDNPLSGLRPILEDLRNNGAVILSARSSYSEARLWNSLTEHPAKDSHHRLTTMKLQPWRRAQLLELVAHLSIDAAVTDDAPEVQQLLTTPFFCLAYAAWQQANQSTDFLRFVIDTYLQRELSKLEGQQGTHLFSQDELAAVFCEVAEMSARKVTPEISEEELALAAEQALERDLSKERRRRLVALCGMSAEWSDEELSFSFTHLAIAEHFFARQVTRVPLQQALSLLSSVAVSSLCAQLIHSMWPKDRAETIEIVVAELQARVTAAESPEHCRPAMASLGELWARLTGTAEGARSACRIVVDRLELRGSGRVTLDQAEIRTLVVGPGVTLRLTSCQVDQLDLSETSGDALLHDSYKQVSHLLTQNELTSSPRRMRELLGVPEEPVDESAIEAFFKDKIANARASIVVNERDFPPDEDVRMRWTREYGIEQWRDYVKKMVKDGKLIREPVNAAGPSKWRLRTTESFDD
ncbi:NACHT domain-containing protein [Streptomyces sp. NPDC102351]|uniref:NACHT domain-containing protein n=1 Tax=Streptomyces sp. NPDC102351 TaxID=3366158 RepID=UPI00380DFDAB